MVFHGKVSAVSAHGYLAWGVAQEIEVRRRSCQLVVLGQNAKYVVIAYATPVFITDTHKSSVDRAVELRRVYSFGQSRGPVENVEVLSQVLVGGDQIWRGRDEQHVTT